MSSKTSSPALKQTMDFELQETSTSVSKMIKPITTVPPSKSKGKTPTKSSSNKKKPTKSKRGTTKTALSMTNLYEKENPFISTVVEPNVGASKKDPKINDAEATGKIAADVASFEVEKGNPDTTLKSVVYESDRKLGLEDLNVVVDSTENMNVNDSKPDDENMGDDSIQPSPEEIDEPKDVGPDVGTSLDQHDQQGNDDGIIKKNESG